MKFNLYSCLLSLCVLFLSGAITAIEPVHDTLPSLSYNMKIVERSRGDCDTYTTPCAWIHFEFPVFSAGLTRDAIDSVNNSIMWMINSNFGDEVLPDTLFSIEDKADSMFNDYVRWQAEEAEKGQLGQSQKVFFIKNVVTVETETERLMTLRFFEWTSAGAHPLNFTSFDNFDKLTGAKVPLDQILISGFEDTLLILAERDFRLKAELTPSENLEEAGYWFKDGVFVLSETYGISSDGIIFYYNLYESGPYGTYPKEIKVSYEALGDYVKEDW